MVGSAMEHSSRLVETLGWPPQGLTSLDSNKTNTGGPNVDKLLETLEGWVQTEATTGVPPADALVETLEGCEGCLGFGTAPRQPRGNSDQLEGRRHHGEHSGGWG